MIATHCANLRLMVQVVPMVQHIDALVLKIKEVQPGLLAAELAADGTTATDSSSRAQLLDELVAVSTKAAAESRALEAKTTRASASLHDAISWLDKSMRNIHEVILALAKNPSACASESVSGLIAPLNGLKVAAGELQQSAQKEAGAEAIRPCRLWTAAAYAGVVLFLTYGIAGVVFLHNRPAPIAAVLVFFALAVATFYAMVKSDRYKSASAWASEVTAEGGLPEYLEREETIANDALELVASARS
jgi:hypothetical protein